jgi:UDP-N-acetylglucosamine pyrophosphorylase
MFFCSYHIAKKKIPYADDNGKRTDAKEVNGWKMEQFIFDIFDSAERMVVFEVMITPIGV